MTMPPAGVPGALTAFSSQGQDPNWDRARKLRARPFQDRLNAYRDASRRWKKSGGLFGAMSWNRPPKAPVTPAELQPYVKAVGGGALAKQVPLPVRALMGIAGRAKSRVGNAISAGKKRVWQGLRNSKPMAAMDEGDKALATVTGRVRGARKVRAVAPGFVSRETFQQPGKPLPAWTPAMRAYHKKGVFVRDRVRDNAARAGSLAAAGGVGAGVFMAASASANKKNEAKRRELFGVRKGWGEGDLSKGTYLARLRSGAEKVFRNMTPSSEDRVRRLAVKLRGDRREFFAATQSTGRGFGSTHNRNGLLTRKNKGADGVYHAELGRREGGAPPLKSKRSIYRADADRRPKTAYSVHASPLYRKSLVSWGLAKRFAPQEGERDNRLTQPAMERVDADMKAGETLEQAVARHVTPNMKMRNYNERDWAQARGWRMRGENIETNGEPGASRYRTKAVSKSFWGGALAKFDETKVSRDEDGKFASKGGSKMAAGAPRPRSVASIYSRGPQWEDKEKPDYDWSRAVGRKDELARMPYGVRQAYADFREKLDRDPPAPPAKAEAKKIEAPDVSDRESSGSFKRSELHPQVPSTMSKEQYTELARWAAQRTKDVRDETIVRSIGRRDPGGHKNRLMLPEGTDPKDKTVRLAANLARNLAMHDVGLFRYDYNLQPDAIKALMPYHPFIKHARRRMANTLRQEKPGAWADFRREFGKEFRDGRTYQTDTAGQKRGEKKKAFARYQFFLKGMPGGALRKSRPLTEAERQQRIKAARASAAARSKARQQPTMRSFEAPGREYAPMPEQITFPHARAKELTETHQSLHRQRRLIRSEGGFFRDGIFIVRPMAPEAAERVRVLEEQIKAVRPDASKAYVDLRLRQKASEEGPRWRNVGLDPARWSDWRSMPHTPPERQFTGVKPQVSTPASRVFGRMSRGSKIAAAGIGAAALVGGAAYGLNRWRKKAA